MRRRSGPPVVFHEAYGVAIGPHVFPTAKYRLVRERLLTEGVIHESQLVRAPPATRQELLRVHTAEYLDKLERGDLTPAERYRLELPWSPALREAARLCAGGSILTGRLALQRGVAVHLGGGFHHAFPDHGEGFCPLNDVAVAVRALLAERRIERAAVVDLDVHHGNGTAAIFGGDRSVFTFDLHQAANYPALKPPGDLDVGLPDGTPDAAYLARLEQLLPDVLDRHRPGIVVYLAGADPYADDQLGGLALTLEGLLRRDEIVIRGAARRGIPIAVLLAGGYARHTADTVTIHATTVRVAVAAAATGSQENERGASERAPPHEVSPGCG